MTRRSRRVSVARGLGAGDSGRATATWVPPSDGGGRRLGGGGSDRRSGARRPARQCRRLIIFHVRPVLVRLTLPTAEAGGFLFHRPVAFESVKGLQGLRKRLGWFGRVPPYLCSVMFYAAVSSWLRMLSLSSLRLLVALISRSWNMPHCGHACRATADHHRRPAMVPIRRSVFQYAMLRMASMKAAALRHAGCGMGCEQHADEDRRRERGHEKDRGQDPQAARPRIVIRLRGLVVGECPIHPVVDVLARLHVRQMVRVPIHTHALPFRMAMGMRHGRPVSRFSRSRTSRRPCRAAGRRRRRARVPRGSMSPRPRASGRPSSRTRRTGGCRARCIRAAWVSAIPGR